MNCRTPSISTSGRKSNMKISFKKYYSSRITSTQDCSGGSGSFPKEKQERGWSGAVAVGAHKLLCHLGGSAMGTLVPVTTTPPGDARGQSILAMPLSHPAPGDTHHHTGIHCAQTPACLTADLWLQKCHKILQVWFEGWFWYQHHCCPHSPSLPPTADSASVSKESLWNKYK